MQRKLDEAHAQLKSYAEKCRHQSQAISSASQELRRLENIIRTLEHNKDKSVDSSNTSYQQRERDSSDECNSQNVEERYLRLMKDLTLEKERCKQYETKCMMLEKRIKNLEQSRKPSLLDFMQVRHITVLGIRQRPFNVSLVIDKILSVLARHCCGNHIRASLRTYCPMRQKLDSRLYPIYFTSMCVR